MEKIYHPICLLVPKSVFIQARIYLKDVIIDLQIVGFANQAFEQKRTTGKGSLVYLRVCRPKLERSKFGIVIFIIICFSLYSMLH